MNATKRTRIRKPGVRAAVAVVMLAIWISLWGNTSTGTLISGAAVAVAVAATYRPTRRRKPHRPRPVALARFVAIAAGHLVTATARVVWEIITPTDRTAEGIMHHTIPTPTPATLLLIVNTIGLTPGTTVLDTTTSADTTTLTIHILHNTDPERTERELDDLTALALTATGNAAMPRKEQRE